MFHWLYYFIHSLVDNHLIVAPKLFVSFHICLFSQHLQSIPKWYSITSPTRSCSIIVSIEMCLNPLQLFLLAHCLTASCNSMQSIGSGPDSLYGSFLVNQSRPNFYQSCYSYLYLRVPPLKTSDTTTRQKLFCIISKPCLICKHQQSIF